MNRTEVREMIEEHALLLSEKLKRKEQELNYEAYLDGFNSLVRAAEFLYAKTPTSSSFFPEKLPDPEQ